MSARDGNGSGNGAPRRPRAKRPRGGGLRRFLRRLATLVVLLALAVVAAGWWGWRSLAQPYPGFHGERRVNVEPGTSGLAILATLEREGVIRDARLARVWLLVQGDPPLQAGEYLFRAPLSTPEALAKVIRGDVVAHRVTVPEGLTLEETADRLVAARLGDRDAFLTLMRDAEPIADLDPRAEDLEGYLFPDSYTFAAATSPRSIVDAMVANFRRRWRNEVSPRLPADGGRTMREVVTLASIVEKEAKAAAERPLIAAVYANRLERGMGLFADPTIIFALKRLGRWDGDIRKADLALDSPYNTYKHAGLPPGPICSSGTGALAAAAAPADVPYLYFVSRNDGTHVFATNLDEHNRNVATWQRRYWRDRRAAERAAGSPSPPARRR
jgi:peptidoglycan lytic transglycosylase G